MKEKTIRLKYFHPQKGEMEVNLGLSVSHYLGPNVGIVNYNHGIRWCFEAREIEIFERDTTIYGYPDPLFQKIITVYISSKKYPFPANAVIYNLDGSVHKVLSPPILIGNLSSYSINPLRGHHFGGLLPGWDINSKGEKIQTLTTMHSVSPINFRYESFYEVREVDVETGEFGELISEGML